MNTLVIVLIAAVCLVCGYVFYGRWLANNGELILRQRLRQLQKRMDRIMFQQTDGQYLHISSHLSRVQVLLPVLFRQQYLAGCLYCSGSSLEVSSLERLQILAHFMPV